MSVLLLDFLTRCTRESVHSSGSPVQQIQVLLDLILHRFVLTVRFELVLGPLRNVGPRLPGRPLRLAVDISERTIHTLVGVEGFAAGAFTGFPILPVCVEDEFIALATSSGARERVRHVHVEHALVERFQLLGLGICISSLDGCEVEIPLGVVDPLTLGSQSG